MTNNDRPAFARLMAGMQELYQEHDMSTERAELYFAALKPYSIDDLRRAIQAHVRDPRAGQFFPKPADLARQIEGTDDDRATVAWRQVLMALRTPVTLAADSPTAKALQAVGGLRTIGQTLESQLHYVERRFRESFSAYARRERYLSLANTVLGSVEPLELTSDDPQPIATQAGDQTVQHE